MTLFLAFFSNDYTLKEKVILAFWVLAGSATIAFFGYWILVGVIWGRPSAQEKADEIARYDCERQTTAEWAVKTTSDGKTFRDRLDFLDEHVWGLWSEFHGKPSGADSLFTDDRALAAGAHALGLTEQELSNLDQQVYEKCGPFPWYETRWGGRVKIR